MTWDKCLLISCVAIGTWIASFNIAFFNNKIFWLVCCTLVHLKVELDKCACVCSERVKMEVTAVEEKCDRRIELLTQSIKKNRKRTRIERAEEDDEEWVPKMFLHTEQNKVKVSGVETSCFYNCSGFSRKASWTSATIFASFDHWCARLQFSLRSIYALYSPCWESSHIYHPAARFSKVAKTFRTRKVIRKTLTRLFCKAGVFICCKENKN